MTCHPLTLQSSFEDVDAIALYFQNTCDFMELVAGAIEEAMEAQTGPTHLPPLMPLLARAVRNFEERELSNLGMEIAKFIKAADAAWRPVDRSLIVDPRRVRRAVA